MKIILATRNAHKQKEFAQMLGADFLISGLQNHPEIGEVAEAATTFLGNATLKAVEVSRQLRGFILADDSGLEVDSLGGAPGIYSARYAGIGATDEMNRRLLLERMSALAPASARAARFHCVLVLAREGEVVASFAGTVEGEIIEAERGGAGFGYDPLFQASGFAQTFAEMEPAEKNAISHRAKAVAKLRDYLEAFTAEG